MGYGYVGVVSEESLIGEPLGRIRKCDMCEEYGRNVTFCVSVTVRSPLAMT